MAPSPRICLITMPFTPITMPGLGISTLKSALVRAGMPTDIYYGALDFFRFFTPAHDPVQALEDYNFLASNGDLGDVFFSAVLWGGPFDPVREVMQQILDYPNSIYSRAETGRLVARLLAYAARAHEFIRHCSTAREWSRYDIVGFSSTFCQNVASLVLARSLRELHPGLHIVFGGANCEGEMGRQMLASFPWLDAIIQGEADFALPDYVRRLREGKSVAGVPGVIYRDGGHIRLGAPPAPVQTLDALPYPDFDDYFAQLPSHLTAPLNLLQLALPIETSRGCWWGAVSHCTFCGLNPTTMSFRSKSPARALSEFRYARDRYGMTNFCAVDNIISMQYFTDVLPQLEGDGLRIFYETKANLKEEQVRQLARAGVTSIQPGIEGLSSEILTLMKKGVKGIQNIALLKWCAIYRVQPVWFYLYRFPYEPHEPYWRDIALFERLVHLPPPRNPNPVIIDRYSPMFREQPQFGLTNLRPEHRLRVSYRGLDEQAIFNIAYHFEADLPQGHDLPYEIPLWRAVLNWQARYDAGARFLQFQTEHTTLLIDTRRPALRAYLLTGAAHHLHTLLRAPQTADQIARAYRELSQRGDEPALSFADLILAHVGGQLGAEDIRAPRHETELEHFLGELEARWIVVALDGRRIALAVDPADVAEARPYGLADFVRPPWDESPPRPARALLTTPLMATPVPRA